MKLTSEFPDVAARIKAALVTAGQDDLVAQIGEVEVIRWTFDKDADASYIYVKSPREINVVETNIIGVKYGETVVFKDDESALVDVDNFGRLTGIELLDFQISPTTNFNDERGTKKPWWKFW